MPRETTLRVFSEVATTAQEVEQKLAIALRLHTSVQNGRPEYTALSRNMNFQSLPLRTKAIFCSFPVYRLLSPTLDVDPFDRENLFDAWIYPLQTGEGDSVEDLRALSSGNLINFVQQGANFSEQTVRLLFALANAEGAQFNCRENTATVTIEGRTFGIIDGVVESRFCTGFLMDVDPEAALNHRYSLKIKNIFFTSLYREAVRRGKGCPEALLALYMQNNNRDWQGWMNKSYSRSTVPTRIQFNKFVQALNRQDDPIGKLYAKLVPSWMTTWAFSKIIGTLESRPLSISKCDIINYTQLLENHFYATKLA